MPRNIHITRHPKLSGNRHPNRESQVQFYLIYFTALFCLIATGWATALFL